MPAGRTAAAFVAWPADASLAIAESPAKAAGAGAAVARPALALAKDPIVALFSAPRSAQLRSAITVPGAIFVRAASIIEEASRLPFADLPLAIVHPVAGHVELSLLRGVGPARAPTS